MKIKNILLALLSVACVGLAGLGLASCGQFNSGGLNGGSDNPDEGGIKTEDFLFQVKDNYAMVIGYEGKEPKVEIPKTYDGFPVTRIEGAFYNCNTVKEVVIPDSVTSMGRDAFYGCRSLKKIVIPERVTSIGGSAFKACNLLTIYCETASKPDGWNNSWNYDNCPVIWGYKETV